MTTEEEFENINIPKVLEDRLWLAGMAMQALVKAGSTDVYNIARQSYAMADVMLEVQFDAFRGA